MSDANSIHTIKWVESLIIYGNEVALFSFFMPKEEILEKYEILNVSVISPNLKSKIKKIRQPNISKIRYLGSLRLLKQKIKNFKPDIVHAHYASSYGLLALLTGFKPFILSVWGSDIYYFPQRNFLNKIVMKKLIKSPATVCSTSKAMKNIIEKEFYRKDVHIVPFGIDVDLFSPNKSIKEKFVVGTIKSIEDYNGIDCLIDSAKIVIQDYKKDIHFIIVGKGGLKKKMEEKVKKLNLENNIEFVGFIAHENVIKYYNMLSIFIAVSRRESFGVSILEAASLEIPSITSNIGGLTEVNLHNETGIVIEPDNPSKLAQSIIKLYKDNELRIRLGVNARKMVLKEFDWNESVNKMLKIYRDTIKNN
jgi:glycosyltransferase involved in cell wall biosynthesis